MKKKSILFLKYQNIFIDFDGVIKDSVAVKADVFEHLFLSSGKEISKKVRVHHEINGGMSRYDKFPIYLEWSGQIATNELVDKYAKSFSLQVKNRVINSEWVPGVQSFLLDCVERKKNIFLITSTPQQEIEEILISLKIKSFFKEVAGSPIKKYNAIKVLLEKYSLDAAESVMIGDYRNDYNAAKINNIQFILRRTALNKDLQKKLNCPMINTFYE